jgi:transposase
LAADGTIEIEFASGARMRVTGAVDPTALRATVEALTGGKSR